MNLGFYWHVPFVRHDGEIRVPSHLGVMLDAFADSAGHVTFYGHSSTQATNEDHVIDPARITTIDLGPLRSFPVRSFRPASSLERYRPAADGVDVMCVLGATALLPAMAKRSTVPVVIMLGTDYSTWTGQAHFPWWRNQLIRAWTKWYTAAQRAATRGRLVMLQAPGLESSVSDPARLETVFVPSLTEEALRRWDAARTPPRPRDDGAFVMLYAGRVVREKGIFEAVDALAVLVARGIDARLRVAGWEDPDSGMIDALSARATELGVTDRVTFLGYLSGTDLLDAYADADVCVLPTYWESFPRAAHDAMAVGTPLVATKVGGIPSFLRDGTDALLVEPRDASALADAVARLATDPQLATSIALSGERWARGHTVEAGIARVVELIREHAGVRS